MASQCAASAAPPSQLVLGVPSSSDQTHALKIAPFPLPHNLRFRNTVRLERRPRLFALFATKSNPSAGDFATKKLNGNATEASDSGEDPPFLTILAGFIVFLVFCWIIGSVLMWLIGLIVRLPTSK